MSRKLLRDLVSCDEVGSDPLLNRLVQLDYTAADAVPHLVKELARLRKELTTAHEKQVPQPPEGWEFKPEASNALGCLHAKNDEIRQLKKELAEMRASTHKQKGT